MKRLKLAVIALFALVTVSNVNAQDENNPWVVGFGVNVVDFSHSSNFSHLAKDALGSSDWNILPSISRLSVDKYLGKGLTLQLAGALNKIKTKYEKNDSDYLYWGVDAVVKYDLKRLFGYKLIKTPDLVTKIRWFDPYVYAGGGYTSADSKGEGMISAGVGFNTWFNKNIGLNFQTGAKKGFSGEVGTHFQHSIGLVIKFGGKDSDGDGVYDREDACPNVAGLKALKGCPDTDGDGIKDSEDACPNVAGLASMNGCPDRDGDGVADKDDACPDVKGTVANHGCPDTDGDGVLDKDDNCKTVPGPVANHGCPWPDTDGDGVLDKDDNCKTVPGLASNHGCPIISKEAIEKITLSARTILFNSSKASFKSGVTGQLDKIVQVMKKFPKANFVIMIEGYADSTGSAIFNLKLSGKRANAVKNYFISKGISSSRLKSKGYGEAAPIDTNRTRKGRANNRRAVVVIKVSN